MPAKKSVRYLPPILPVLVLVLILVFSCPILRAQQLPSPVGFVNDFAGVIDSQSKAQMEGIAGSLQAQTGAEIAVVTVQTIQPYGSIEEYTVDLATEWGIGKEDEDTGILILLAMEERRIRLEVGYGLEGLVPDGLAGEIIDQSILPALRSGDYGTGLLRGVQAVAGIIAKEYGVELGDYRLVESRKYTRPAIPIGLIMFIIFAFLFGGGRFLLWPLLFMGAASRRGFYGGGFGSGGGGFGSSGGFSGFGGGGFGGGGASRGF
jgi:uncharacterized protein